MTTGQDLKAQMEASIALATATWQFEYAEKLRQKQKFRAYKQQHRQLQQAHRLLVLEHKELRAKYVNACSHIMSLECELGEFAQKRSHFPSED